MANYWDLFGKISTLWVNRFELKTIIFFINGVFKQMALITKTFNFTIGRFKTVYIHLAVKVKCIHI